MTHYIAANPADDVIWGAGKSEAEAKADAMRWIEEWLAQDSTRVAPGHLVVLRASPECIESLYRLGGEDLRWYTDFDGVAVLEAAQ